MVKISSWNIRGLNDLNKQRVVRKLICDNKLDVLAIMETRVKYSNSEKVMKKIVNHGSWLHNYSRAYNGRIWVWWNTLRVQLMLITVDDQFMHCKITVDNLAFYCTFVYAYNCAEQRVCLWEKLLTVSGSCSDPWILLGDFNSMLYPTEKQKGGVLVTPNITEL